MQLEAKKKAEKARKERRKAEEGARGEAIVALQQATAGEDADQLSRALETLLLSCGAEGAEGAEADGTAADAAKAGGLEAEAAVVAARTRLSELSDPDWQRRRERQRSPSAAKSFSPRPVHLARVTTDLYRAA